MNPTPEDCLITGIGMRCSLGQDAVQSCAAIRAGIARFADWAHFAASFGEEETTIVGAPVVPDLGDRTWIEKLDALATQPLLEALWAAGLSGLVDPTAPTRWRLYLATPREDRPGIDPDDLAEYREDVLDGTLFPVDSPGLRTFPEEHSGGLVALDAAMKDLASGAIDVGVVGGVDSLLQTHYLYDLLAAGRLKTGLTTSGLIPGEAAAFAVVETRRHAERRDAEPLARLTPVRLARESVPAGDPSRAEALAQVLREALADLDGPTQGIHRVLTDLNGERWRFLEWAMVAARSLAHIAPEGRPWHPADCTGDLGAATGPAFLCLAARAFRRGYAVGDAIPICTSSDTGARAALCALPPA